MEVVQDGMRREALAVCIWLNHDQTRWQLISITLLAEEHARVTEIGATVPHAQASLLLRVLPVLAALDVDLRDDDTGRAMALQSVARDEDGAPSGKPDSCFVEEWLAALGQQRQPRGWAHERDKV